VYTKRAYYPKSRDELHRFWRSPWEGSNNPKDYLYGEARSLFLVKLMKKHVKPDEKILEIGCNVGRNLRYLFSVGYARLHAVEISEEAIQLFKQVYSETANHTKIYNAAVEETVKRLGDCEFDAVFTMATLNHIHTDSEWIFSEIVRTARHVLITIEDEKGLSWRHFPRNYKKVFERLGMNEIEEHDCSDIEGLGGAFCARVFEKEQLY